MPSLVAFLSPASPASPASSEPGQYSVSANTGEPGTVGSEAGEPGAETSPDLSFEAFLASQSGVPDASGLVETGEDEGGNTLPEGGKLLPVVPQSAGDGELLADDDGTAGLDGVLAEREDNTVNTATKSAVQAGDLQLFPQASPATELPSSSPALAEAMPVSSAELQQDGVAVGVMPPPGRARVNFASSQPAVRAAGAEVPEGRAGRTVDTAGFETLQPAPDSDMPVASKDSVIDSGTDRLVGGREISLLAGQQQKVAAAPQPANEATGALKPAPTGAAPVDVPRDAAGLLTPPDTGASRGVVDSGAQKSLPLPPMVTTYGDPGWNTELAGRVTMAVKQGSQEANIQLTPPELGKLEIKISTDGDQAKVLFQVHSVAARDAIEQAMPRLRDMMQNDGIVLTQGEVFDQSAQQQYDSNGDGGGGEPVHDIGLSHAMEGGDESQSALLAGMVPGSGIDYYV